MRNEKKQRRGKPEPPFNMVDTTDCNGEQTRYFLFEFATPNARPVSVERFERSWRRWWDRSVQPVIDQMIASGTLNSK